MKTRFSVILALGLGILCATASAGTESKDYTRYTGMNLVIRAGDSYYHILGVKGTDAIIRASDGYRLVPFSDIKAYRIERTSKIAPMQATLGNLTIERAYTPANNPKTRGLNGATRALGDVDYMTTNSTTRGPSGSVDAICAFQSTTTVTATRQDGEGGVDERMWAAEDAEQYDAAHIAFRLSAPAGLAHPYLVVVADFKESEKSSDTSRWIYIRELNPISGGSAELSFTQGGFPPGYQMQRTEIHIYDEGKEVPTNYAQDRVAMTRDEVAQLITDQYVSAHRGQSAPPFPIRGMVPAVVREKLGSAELVQTVEVKVGKDGRLVDSSAAEDYLQDCRFCPALDNGHPVDGSLRIKLADLVR